MVFGKLTVSGEISMRKIKYCKGWYKPYKTVQRHMKPLYPSNNYRKMHGEPLRRNFKKEHLNRRLTEKAKHE